MANTLLIWLSQPRRLIAPKGRRPVKPPHPAIDGRLHRTLRVEERRGRRLMVIGRTAALIAVAVIVTFLVEYPAVVFLYGLILLFILIGLAMWWLDLRGRYRPWHSYLFAALDLSLVSIALVLPNPLNDAPYPVQFRLHFDNDIYLYIFLAGLAFSYRPWLVVWGGVVGAVVWSIAILWIWLLPTTTRVTEPLTSVADVIPYYADPTFIDVGDQVQGIAVYLIVAGLLSLAVLRARHLLFRQARLERERSNLARYFPAETVDLLSQNDTALTVEREQQVTVLFADIVGFTRFAEDHPPHATIALLRDVHGIIERQVFRHNGAIDKFIGDGAMATFGTVKPVPEDPANALACAIAVLEDIDRYNQERGKAGAAPVQLSLGLHHGPVVIGDIGSERRLELAVLGDTVNVASRLEELTRALQCRAVVSDALVDALPYQDADGMTFGLSRHSDIGIRGRAEPLAIWTL